MSTLRVNTLANQGGTQSTAIENAINGSAKAWVNFNGTGTVAIRASYNVSSITDNNTGDYTVNFTNAMSDKNYAVNVSTSSIYGVAWSGASGLFSEAAAATEVTPTTTAFRFGTRNSSVAVADVKYACVAIFR